MPSIPFNAENIKKCVCPACPVQTKSQCVRQELSGLQETLKHNPLKAEAVPALYCASGTASCQDINFARECICAVCPVYVEFSLKSAQPVLYYCRDGASV